MMRLRERPPEEAAPSNPFRKLLMRKCYGPPGVGGRLIQSQIAKKVAISLSIGCAIRFGNHSRRIDVGKLFMNHLSHREQPRPV
ncbi:hypothetical protein AVEN_82878-1 [Araneus ventricosus]|uniref:Uncharacterized protein n=1 Tax=Araneus ventricosus TaxID=182803 RepID=A0A4Y2QR96_ARAVE|nr:hypothetical protein AVEN_82878-1 [Araneus ventricosus]